jgi:two-component system, sensor histidine kinase and response regulator
LSQSIWVFEDVTDRKRAEEEQSAHLARIEAQVQAVGAISVSQALMAGDVERLAREVTEAAAQVTGVARANVWLFKEDESELHCIDLYEAASGGHTLGAVLRQEQFQNEFRALKGARYVNADDPLTDPRTAGYVETYLKPLRITSMLDAVVQFSGRHLGLLCLEHVDRAHHWEDDEITFACQLADKIALAITSKARHRAEAELQRSMEATIQAVAATVELRDPYTTGHQNRVAELAAAIARELGLPEHLIHGIHLAGVVHDWARSRFRRNCSASPRN